tara:strand:- start:548 stop:733 length:186 start_codon:yes stop_codon:yes gene_type:complete
MSKGSRPRPFSVSQEEIATRHETIFGKKPPKEKYIPPPLPDLTEVKTAPKVQWMSGNESNS